MKKLLSIIALLMAFAASSMADWYVVGNLTNFTPTPSASIDKMALLDGTTDTYYADFKPNKEGLYFCIADGDGDDWADFNSNHRYSSGTTNQEVSNGCYSVQLGLHGEGNLFLDADGTTTYRIMLVESTKKLTVTKVDNYVVAGCFVVNNEETASFFGTKWDDTSEANKMTLLTDGSYKKTYEGIDLSAGDIKYKITNAEWKHKTEADQTKNISEAGKYNITFQFWVDNINSPVCTIERAYSTINTVGLSGDVAASLTKGEGYVWTGELALDSRLTENKTFRLTVDNAVIGSQKLTLVGNGLVTASETENDPFTLLATSPYQTYNVTAEWTPSDDVTAGWTLTIAGKDKEVPVSYAIVGDWTDNGAGWAADRAMTQDTENPNIYTLTVPEFNVEFAEGQTSKTYYYKLRANGKWGVYDLPASGNNNKVFSEEGTYKLVFTADVSANTLSLVAIPGEVLWSGEPRDMGNWAGSNAVSLNASQFANAVPGDILHISVEDVTPGNSWDAQVVLKKGDWSGDLSETYNVGTGDVSIASFVLTGDILKYAKQNGIVVFGHHYTTSTVTLQTGVYSPGSEYSVWVGDQELSWSQVQVQPIHFTNLGLEAGKVLRLRYDAVEGKSPNVQLKYGWEEGQDYGTPIYADGTAMMVVREDMISPLMNNNLIINATGIRLKQIELVPFKYFVVSSDNSWTTSTEMTESEGVFAANLEYVAGKYFAIFPITALNADANKISETGWNKAIRPTVNSGNFDVNYFVNYQSTTTTGNDAVWYVATNNTAKLALTYTPSLETNNYTITTDATEKVTISDAGWATYSNDQAFSVTGAEAYITKDISKSVKLEKIANPVFAGGKGKGKGILLKGSSGKATEVTIAPTEVGAEFADLTDNYLAGSGNATYDITGYFGGNDGTYTSAYILKKIDGVVGFYKLASFETDNVIDAHKAFLAVPEGVSVDSRLFLGFDDGETTSIDVRSKMEDGRGDVYNLNGQRVAQPTKGLYIVNGRKVVIK